MVVYPRNAPLVEAETELQLRSKPEVYSKLLPQNPTKTKSEKKGRNNLTFLSFIRHIFFLKFFFSFMCVCVPACLYMHHVYTDAHRDKIGQWIPGTRITGSHEPHDMGTESYYKNRKHSFLFVCFVCLFVCFFGFF